MQVKVQKRGRDEEVVEVSPEDTVREVCKTAGVLESSAVFFGDKKLKLDDKIADTGVAADSVLREEAANKLILLFEELCGLMGEEVRSEECKKDAEEMEAALSSFEENLVRPLPTDVRELLLYTYLEGTGSLVPTVPSLSDLEESYFPHQRMAYRRSSSIPFGTIDSDMAFRIMNAKGQVLMVDLECGSAGVVHESVESWLQKCVVAVRAAGEDREAQREALGELSSFGVNTQMVSVLRMFGGRPGGMFGDSDDDEY